VLPKSVPFNERGGRLRGVLDAVSGRFPRFVFGGRVGPDLLPVFHFHDEPPDDLEPKLRYLVDNGYRAVTSEEIARFVDGRLPPDPHRVALCFDDVWASVWTVAAPLLEQYGLTAIAYAIPGRIEDSDCCRARTGRSAADGSPLVTWPELRALHASGVVDVQSHTYSHSKIFCSAAVTGYVTPDFGSTPLLNRPRIADSPSMRFVTPDDLGAPLYLARSRMSSGLRVCVDPEVHLRCVAHVSDAGGRRFFERAHWRAELDAIARKAPAHVESETARRSAIEEELDRARSILNDRLRTRTVNHVCLPWGVSSEDTAGALKRLGFGTAFANRLRGVHAVRRGDNRYWLKRLPNKYIFRLPGRGRRIWRTTLPPALGRAEHSRGMTS
jgi:peptidoglycan/xylan/chitin deacetylase (PgdA/CDA1 family)